MSTVVNLFRNAFGRNGGAKGMILGLDGSGKTTVLYKWKSNIHVQTIPTIGFNVETISCNGVDITFYDVGGCDKIRPLWKHYFTDTDVLIFCWPAVKGYDDKEIEDHLGDLLSEEALENIPVCVVVTRCDEDVGGIRFKSIEQRLHRWFRENNKKGRLYHIVPFHPNMPEYLKGLEWAATVCKMSLSAAKRPQKDDKVKEAKDEGAKLAQWLIDTDLDESDDDFLANLESGHPKSWDHRTHLRLAWLYLTRLGRRQGKDKIFEVIENVIKTSEIARKTTFHVTMTYFWIQMVHYAMVATKNPDSTFKMFLVLNPQLSNGSLYLQYYRKETILNNEQARKEFVLPDVKPFPDVIKGAAFSTGIFS